jgi:hypothetical protein
MTNQERHSIRPFPGPHPRREVVFIGHCDLVPQSQHVFEEGNQKLVYISILEAIYRERLQQEPDTSELMEVKTIKPRVEIHFESTPDDDRRLAPLRQESRERYRADKLSQSDGWTFRPDRKESKCP